MWKICFFFIKIEFYNLNGINSEKEGMSISTYISNIVSALMQLLTVFYSLICLSDRTTRDKCSMLIIKTTQHFTLYWDPFLQFVSYTCCGHFSSHHQPDRPMKNFTQNVAGKCPSNSWAKLRRK